MTFGQYIRHHRFLKRMPLNYLVAKTGLEPLHLLNLETDIVQPSRDDAMRLAKALRLPTDFVLEKAGYAVARRA